MEMEAHKKIYRAVRLDPDLDRAVFALLDVWRGPKGHRKTFSQFMRDAARSEYNRLATEYNARIQATAQTAQ
jgi:hypothetical protein